MPLDALAIITPKAGKEARVEELLAGLAVNVQEHEPDVERYVPTKVVGREGTPEYVVIERYALTFGNGERSNASLEIPAS